MLNKKSFTIVEFIIILALVAGISSLIYFQIKPQQYFQLARDSKRINDLKNLSLILDTLYLEDQNLETGLSTNTIYISLPDAATNCQSWLSQLPSLPNNFNYRCSSNPILANGQGWLPIDFTTSSRSKLIKVSSLPLDPLNKPPYYYSFVVGGSYELTAALEADVNRNINGPAGKDGGTSWNVYEVGNDLKLTPLSVEDGGGRDPSLVGYWSFDEGTGTIAYDRSGYNNNGTLYNGPQWTTGKVGGALSFDGVNDYVNILTQNSFPGGSSDRTILAWVYPNSYPFSINHIFHYGNSSIGQAWGLAVWDDSRLGAHEWGSYNRYGSVPLNNWSFLVITLKSNWIKNHYINGILVGVGNYTPNTTLNLTPKIGSRVSPGEYWNGLIDEVRVYNRALDESEIKALYEATK